LRQHTCQAEGQNEHHDTTLTGWPLRRPTTIQETTTKVEEYETSPFATWIARGRTQGKAIDYRIMASPGAPRRGDAELFHAPRLRW
jgi:hypothetical protein